MANNYSVGDEGRTIKRAFWQLHAQPAKQTDYYFFINTLTLQRTLKTKRSFSKGKTPTEFSTQYIIPKQKKGEQ